MKISLLRKNKSRQKIESYHGLLLFETASKLIKLFLTGNLQFIARVGAGLESIDCDYAVSKKTLIAAPEGIGMQLQSIL
jgi:D-3-phosphoglycerate dehydrogenase